ncbi:Aste57867_7524 [Aphanomyces stellatus]|uniref:Aste57867_7524 protein n=1 Tax=Aphanomyces stellatus TaxID=120398 RepID=A0A485KIG3_9STRA|nr:hypothetical protein As57867_007498 [Aphanomyces stellatus]VFT84433.1 Aste57867_7524 [Aphanomyces stellatus]
MFRARKTTSSKKKARHIDGDEDDGVAPPVKVLPQTSFHETADGEVDEAVDVAAVRNRIKQKHKKPADFSSKKRPLPVSLGDDDDEDVPAFRVKKGKIARVRVPLPDADDERAASTEYSAEGLEALKAQQKFTSYVHAAPMDDDEGGLNGTAEPSPPAPTAEETFIPLSESPSREAPTSPSHRHYHMPEEASLQDDGNNDDAGVTDESNADTAWEAEQLRRVGIHASSSSHHTAPTQASDLTFQSLGQLMGTLTAQRAALADKTDVLARDTQRIHVEITSLASGLAAMETALADAAATYDDVQGLWEYLSTLCFCLRAKATHLDVLEAEAVMHTRASIERALWDDVGDDYASLPALVARFEAWQHGPHAAMYEATYGALALEQLVVPYIRADLLAYHPWVHRWEELPFAQTLHGRVDLLQVGVDLVAAKAMRLVSTLDWLSLGHVQHAKALLASLPAAVAAPLAAAMADQAMTHHQQRHMQMSMTQRMLFKKQLTTLRLAPLDALILRLCQDELTYVQQHEEGDIVDHIKRVVEDWPAYLDAAKPMLREYAALLQQTTTDGGSDTHVVTKRALLINIELKLQR